MKKGFKRITTVILVAMLCGNSLFGCSCKNESSSSPNEPITEALYNPEQGIDRTTVLSSIVQNGATDYKIVYGVDASKTELYAASELQSFIYEATGVRLPLVVDSLVERNPQKLICIGQNSILDAAELSVDYSALGADGFVLKTKDSNLYIVGGKRGTLYGVYDWLEKICGVKFIASDYTYVADLSEIKLYAMDVIETPAFEYRGSLACSTYYSKDEIFYARSRNNHEFLKTEEKYGGGIRWYDGVNTTHNTLNYVDPNVYYATPEDKKNNAHMFFVNGNEVEDICYTDGITEDGKLDESMPLSAAKVAIESLKSYMLDDAECDYYMFGHMDTRLFCTCTRCNKMASKYGKSGVYIRFANVLYDEVQKWADNNLNGQELKLVIFAYLLSEQAPVSYNADEERYQPIDETVIPRDNIAIRLAPIDANRYYTVQDEKQTSTKYKDWLKKWGAVTDNFMAWTYSIEFNNYFWYYPTKHTFVDMLKGYQEIGVKYMFVQNGHQEANDWQSIMYDYLLSKLLWNPNRDVNELVKEFVHYYFGGLVEDKVLDFIETYDEYFYLAQEETQGMFIYNSYTSPIYNKYEYVNYGLTLLNESKEIIANSVLNDDEKAIYTKHIDMARLMPLYMLMYNGGYYFSGNASKQKAIVDEFFGLCEELNAVYYEEDQTIESIKSKYGYEG